MFFLYCSIHAFHRLLTIWVRNQLTKSTTIFFTSSMGISRVERELADQIDRSAYFVCALCLAWPDGHHDVFEGRVDGDLVWPPRGDRGFGYDPIFRPAGYEVTFGEMEPTAKHAMSHRARAFEKFLAETMDHG